MTINFNEDDELLAYPAKNNSFDPKRVVAEPDLGKITRKETIIIIPDGEYFQSDFLPNGIINKTETGIGGTTVESKSRRNSIIVEPLKSIAATKAMQLEDSLYVGSPTQLYHDSKVVTDNDIKKYHLSTIKYKKIFVVADSLPRLIECIGESVYKDYFLLIDEIDSYQEDAAFRVRLEKCIDYYNFFPQENRALISATINEFSNPTLANENYTIVKYEQPTTRQVELVLTDNVNCHTIEKILNLYKKGEKIAVAYNALKPIMSIIEILIKDHGIDKNEFGVLCGETSSETAGEFYRDFESNLLPNRITFKTSAYFSGIDINEQYHLISVVNTRIPYTILSVNKFKQIAGRCRHKNKLLSETIIFNEYKEELSLVAPTTQSLINDAKRDLSVFNCISILNGKGSEKKYLNLKQKFYEVLGGESPDALLRINYNEEFDISYFKIDRLLEIYKTHFMYSITYLREELIRNNVRIEKREIYYNNDGDAFALNNFSGFKELRKEQIKNAIDRLSSLQEPTKFSIQKLKIDRQKFKYETAIYNEYEHVVGYVSHNDFIQYLSKMNLESKSDLREFYTLINKLWFKTLPSDSNLKQILNKVFKTGEKYKTEYIIKHLNQITTTNAINPKNKAIVNSNQINFFRRLYETKRTKIKNENGIYIYVYQILDAAVPEISVIAYNNEFKSQLAKALYF